MVQNYNTSPYRYPIAPNRVKIRLPPMKHVGKSKNMLTDFPHFPRVKNRWETGRINIAGTCLADATHGLALGTAANSRALSLQAIA